MKAIVARRYGPPDVLRVEDVPKPAPRPGEVLVEMRAASVNAADWHILRADPWFVRLMGFGLLRPKNPILGVDGAGRVESVGEGVTRFHPGDEVYGDFYAARRGSFAQYSCARERDIARKPATLSFEEAAALPVAATTALQGLRDHGHIQPGQEVLIHGASGGVGTFAVQLAKDFGARVSAVGGPLSQDYLRSLGADIVMDYTREDFARGGARYDLIVSLGGNRSIFDYRRALKARGTYVLIGGAMGQLYRFMLLSPWLSMLGGKTFRNFVSSANQADLEYLSGRIESGRLRVPIARRYALQDVPEAIRHLEEKHPQGKIVITI